MSIGRRRRMAWSAPSQGSVAEQINWIGFFLLTTVAAIPGLVLLAWVTSRTKVATAGAAAE